MSAVAAIQQQARPKILVIDDEAAMVDACSQTLAREAYEVEVAYDGEDGLAKTASFHPDLIIADLKMPKVGGMEVLERCREIDETIVAVVITGYATVDSAVEAMKRGAYDFLPKPFTPDALRIIVKRGLERRRLIQQSALLREQKRKLEENLVTMASHQLKSHIAAIQQYFEVLRSGVAGALPQAQQSIIQMTSPRLEVLRRIIDDWLVYARIGHDGIREHLQLVDTAAVVRDVVTATRLLADAKEITVDVECDAELPRIRGHELSLNQVFTNLVQNAIKYNRPGGKVNIKLCEKDGHVVVEISDTGIGIAEEDLPFLFEQFFRGRGEAARTVSGTGLGLCIAKKIVDIHSGTIQVASVAGQGSTFTVRLPI